MHTYVATWRERARGQRVSDIKLQRKALSADSNLHDPSEFQLDIPRAVPGNETHLMYTYSLGSAIQNY